MSIDDHTKELLHDLARVAIRIAGYPDNRSAGLDFANIASWANDEMIYALGEQSDTEILRLLREAARLWIEKYGHEDYVSGPTSMLVPFIGAAEKTYFETHKKFFPDRHDGTSFQERSRLRQSLFTLINREDVPSDGVPVIYYHIGERAEIIYVGQSRHFVERQKDHRRGSRWWNEIESIEWEEFPSESLDHEEKVLIQQLRPRFNIMHNGDAAR